MCFPDACAWTWTPAQGCPPSPPGRTQVPGLLPAECEMGAGAVRTGLGEWDSANRRPCLENARQPGRSGPFSEPGSGLTLELYLNASIVPQWTGRRVCSPPSKPLVCLKLCNTVGEGQGDASSDVRSHWSLHCNLNRLLEPASGAHGGLGYGLYLLHGMISPLFTIYGLDTHLFF